ncbi:unnamed protein product, partial [marine sediment metagenome]
FNLHGSIRKKEKCPGGSKDENVFDIQQGVAIVLLIKKTDKRKNCKVYYSDIWGLREKKYKFLIENEVNTTRWQNLIPKSEHYLFIPRNEKLFENYQKYLKINEIFVNYSLSIQTHRDGFVIQTDKEVLKRRIKMFKDIKLDDELIRQTFNLQDTGSWELRNSRKRVMDEKNWQDYIVKILYRPFDIRWIFYHNEVVDRTRKNIMTHMSCKNIALLVSRQQSVLGFYHSFITDLVSESCVVSNKTREGNYHFPLYLYPGTDEETLLSRIKSEKREPNFRPLIFDNLCKCYKKNPKQ